MDWGHQVKGKRAIATAVPAELPRRPSRVRLDRLLLRVARL